MVRCACKLCDTLPDLTVVHIYTCIWIVDTDLDHTIRASVQEALGSAWMQTLGGVSCVGLGALSVIVFLKYANP